MPSPMGEFERNSRLHKVFSEIEKAGVDGKTVLRDLLAMTAEDILKNKTAMSLMSDWLTPEEMNQFVRDGEIEIKSRLYPGRRYKITKGRADMTQVYEGGVHTQDLCVHATQRDELPYGDAILTKIVALKTDEQYFLRNSNARQIATAPPGRVRTVGSGNVAGGIVTISGCMVVNDERFVYNPDHYNPYNARDLLDHTRQRMSLRDIGLVSTPPQPNPITHEQMGEFIKIVAAQAVIDGISATPAGLTVRGLMVEQDFDWSQTAAPKSWRQGPFPQSSVEHEVYRTNAHCYSDRKVYLLYGFMNLMAMQDCPVNYVKIMRSPYRVTDQIDISHIHKTEVIPLKTPVIYKRNDDMVIRFGLDERAAGKETRIMMLGCVAESLGMTMMG